MSRWTAVPIFEYVASQLLEGMKLALPGSIIVPLTKAVADTFFIPAVDNPERMQTPYVSIYSIMSVLNPLSPLNQIMRQSSYSRADF